MDRRNLVLGAVGSAVSGLVMSRVALGAAAATSKATDKLVESTSHCVTVGLACLAHCQKELAQGNKTMADCSGAVSDTIAACEALQKLAARGSSHTAALAKATAQICADCAKACEAHAAHMEICKACMNACRDCEKACNAAA